MSAQTVLEINDMHVHYGKVEAVHGISFKVSAGAIVSVIGPNGAGKSTTLNAVMGTLPVNASASGQVILFGEEVSGISVEDRVARGISLVPETRELFGAMTVQDNLRLGAYRRKKAGDKDFLDQLDAVYRIFPRLKERAKQDAGTLSGGERQMLALGRALMAKPRVLMLDEPSLGLAPLIVKEIFHVIGTLRETGVAMLLIEQNARAALQVSDYGYVMETGDITLEGSSQDLAVNPKVVETYLGLSKKTA